jgi:phage major head subunit gpT-like protein
MGALDQVKLQNAMTGFDTRFHQTLANLRASNADARIRQLTERRDLTTDGQIDFKWLGFPGAVRRWKAERKPGKLRAGNYVVRTVDWENSIDVHKNDIKDDKLQLYPARIDHLAQSFFDHQEQRLIQLLASGFATTMFGACYDGKPFFAHDHGLENGQVNDNLVHKTLDDDGAFDEAMQLALSMKRDDGVALDVMPTLLICGPADRANALKLLKRDRDAAGASNINYQATDLWVCPYLRDNRAILGENAKGDVVAGTDDSRKWFLLALGKPSRPAFHAVREEPWTESNTTGDKAYSTGDLSFGAAARYEMAYGYYQLAIGSDGSV